MKTEEIGERVNILGVGVSAVNMDTAIDRIDGWVHSHELRYVCVCPVHSIMECRRSQPIRHIFNSAGMVTPDGMPVVWVARWSGHREVHRVYGPDLMLAVLGRQRHRHFFYGGGSGVAQRLAELMKRRFPDLDVAGVLEPPFAPLDQLCTPQAAAPGADLEAALRPRVALSAGPAAPPPLAALPDRQSVVRVGARPPENRDQKVRAGALRRP